MRWMIFSWSCRRQQKTEEIYELTLGPKTPENRVCRGQIKTTLWLPYPPQKLITLLLLTDDCWRLQLLETRCLFINWPDFLHGFWFQSIGLVLNCCVVFLCFLPFRVAAAPNETNCFRWQHFTINFSDEKPYGKSLEGEPKLISCAPEGQLKNVAILLGFVGQLSAVFRFIEPASALRKIL